MSGPIPHCIVHTFAIGDVVRLLAFFLDSCLHASLAMCVVECLSATGYVGDYGHTHMEWLAVASGRQLVGRPTGPSARLALAWRGAHGAHAKARHANALHCVPFFI